MVNALPRAAKSGRSPAMILRIKGVKPVRSKGKVYYYHRKTMARLPGHPGSREFLAALDKLNAGKDRSIPGTLGGLIAAYRASPEFLRLAANTCRNYQLAFDILAPNAARPLVTITADSLYELRDMLAQKRGRTTVNRTLTVLRIVYEWATKRGHYKGQNPVGLVDKLRRPHGTRQVNRPWTDAELEAMLAAAGSRLRLVITLAAFTGLRASDVLAVTWACYDGRAFETKTQKTGQRVWVPVHSALRQILDATPRTYETIVPPITAGAVRTAFYKLQKQLGLAGLSLHGLRHTLGTKLAEAGCDAATIAAVLGHANARMSEHYSRHANRDFLAQAAMAKLDKAENARR